jgi:hypothetical protein
VNTRKALLLSALTAAIVLAPAAGLAQAASAAAGEALPWLAIAGIAWFAIDKIIDLLPLRENTLVGALRAAINALFAKK